MLWDICLAFFASFSFGLWESTSFVERLVTKTSSELFPFGGFWFCKRGLVLSYNVSMCKRLISNLFHSFDWSRFAISAQNGPKILIFASKYPWLVSALAWIPWQACATAFGLHWFGNGRNPFYLSGTTSKRRTLWLAVCCNRWSSRYRCFEYGFGEGARRWCTIYLSQLLAWRFQFYK